MKKILFSGVQPSGTIHIGNLFGALKQWVEFQNEYKSIFFIADLHAITTPQNPKILRKNIINTAKTLVAMGIDTNKSLLFIQSHIPEHLELSWVLGSITRVSELLLMTQYKDKSSKQGNENTSAGLLNYPVLMASDILLYSTNVVPVGDDQKQHLELTRELARRFNKLYGKTFIIPEAKIIKNGARIRSLEDPVKKMSKSFSSSKSYISLMDTPIDIKKKIKTSKTDSGNEIKYNMQNKPGISNLLSIYSLASNKRIKEIEDKYKGVNYGVFKEDVADAIIEYLLPIQKKLKSLDNKKVLKYLENSEKVVKDIAKKKIKDVYKKIGFI